MRSRSIARGRSHLWPPEVHWRSPGTACSALVDGARECHVTLALAFSTHKRDAEGSLTLPNTLFCHTCRPARRAVCGLLAVAGQSSRLSTLTIVTGQASRPARQPRSKPRCNNSSYGRSAPLRGASNTWGFPEPFLAMCGIWHGWTPWPCMVHARLPRVVTFRERSVCKFVGWRREPSAIC